MASGDDRQEISAAAEALARQRGYHIDVYDWLAEKDPEFEKLRLEYISHLYTPSNPTLPVKYRELIVSILLAFRGLPSTKMHLRRALNEGATMQELIEAFETASLPGGLPVMSFGLKQLIELESEMAGSGSEG